MRWFDNYTRAFELVTLPRYTLNSLFVVAIAMPLTILFASFLAAGHSSLATTSNIYAHVTPPLAWTPRNAWRRFSLAWGNRGGIQRVRGRSAWPRTLASP